MEKAGKEIELGKNMTDFIVKIYTLYRMKTENDLKIIDFLAKSYLCEGLSEDQIEELSSFAIMIYLKENEILFDEGDRTGLFFVVATGKLKVLITSSLTDEVQELRSINPGDCIGEMAMIEESTHTTRIAAVKPSSLLSFNSLKLLEHLKQHPDTGVQVLLNLSKIISSRLRFLGHPCDLLFINDNARNNI